MRFIILALALLPAVAMAQDRAPDRARTLAAPVGVRQCANPETQWAARPPATLRARPLAQEPPANRYLGVMRIEDGCDKPVKVAEKIGRAQR